MDALTGMFSTLFNLLLVVVGFGLVVFIHEMGHFLTARWAGIRVHAFALGFGPAIFSFRKGMGWRRGSSEREYFDTLKQRTDGPAMSPTEYRLNALPFGGYVKMLGQHDLHPENAGDSTPTDSYLAKPIWKRMIVISGGVVMNVLLALAIFMFVFFVGLDTEPAKVGQAQAESPAARAVALNAEELGVVRPGLLPDDVVLTVNGRAPDDFNDIVMAAAMTGREGDVKLEVRRAGIDQPLVFEIEPERNQFTNLLDLGVEPSMTLEIPIEYASQPESWNALAQAVGLPGVQPGMKITGVDGDPTAASFGDLLDRAQRSGGRSLELTFADDNGATVSALVDPRPRLMLDDADPNPGTIRTVQHLLGMIPVMTVERCLPEDRGHAQGLRTGDTFKRLGALEFPTIDAGIREVQRRTGQPIDIVVLRQNEVGETEEVVIADATVGADGRIGFTPGDTGTESALVALAPNRLQGIKPGSESFTPAATLAITRPGSRVLGIDGTPVTSFAEMRAALITATANARVRGEGVSVEVELAPPLPPRLDGTRLTETVTLDISAGEVARLHDLGWDLPFGSYLFRPEAFTLRADGPVDAIRMGVNRTQRMMLMTYLTIARLVEGTVKVDNLKGPVGIAHLGTQVATRGLVWLLFFMGLISVNLAVINFLPMPIADGGQFLMLLYEQLRGKPLPIPVQNGITAFGLLMLVSVFVLVTYNDVARLLGG